MAATLALALLTNSLFKFGMVASLGGRALDVANAADVCQRTGRHAGGLGLDAVG